MKNFFLIAVLVLTCVTGLHSQNLQTELLQLQGRSGGTLGVVGVHLEKGFYVALNENQRFPMASVYKLPIGIYVLHLVHEGKINLSDSLKINADNVGPRFSPLLRRWQNQGDFYLSIESLLQEMISTSDNTACDVLLQMVGGPERIGKYFTDQSLLDFQINRNERQMQQDHIHAVDPEFQDFGVDDIDSLLNTFSDEESVIARAAFLKDRRDTATPKGMNGLLAKVYNRSLAKFSHYDLLSKYLLETPRGVNRIKAGVPSGSIVAHKPGTHRTLAGVNLATNDVGIITLPDGGHILLSIFLKGSTLPDEQREALLADVARKVCAAWTR